jgi:2-dehydropantoate 2-reductase
MTRMMDGDFAILGSGAIGSIIGAHLARSGCSVVMLARGRRGAQIMQLGLRITGIAEFSQTVPVLTEPSRLRRAGVLIVATKANGTQAALAPLRGAVIERALSIQNGLMKDELLADFFGRDRVLGALADTSGELLPSGEVVFTRNVNIYLGELDGGDPSRAQQIAGTIDASGVRSIAVTNIQSLEWSKFASWVGMMVLSVTTRAPTWKYATDPESALLVVRLVREVGLLARARGVQLSDQSTLPVVTICGGSEQEAVAAILRIGLELKSTAPQHRVSALHDLEGGRPLEVGETLGYALKMGQRLNLSLPLLSAVYPLVSAIDRVRG